MNMFYTSLLMSWNREVVTIYKMKTFNASSIKKTVSSFYCIFVLLLEPS